MITSDVSDALACRWDDGTFVVDPRSTVRAARDQLADPDESSGAILRNAIPAPPPTAMTLEEWQRANGYDATTRTYG